MELASKLLLLILFVSAFLQNGIKAITPMDALYWEMYMELSRQSTEVFYARAEGEPWMPVLTKLEMGRHIYAKIDLLEGILAELQAKRDQMGAEREYFVDEKTAIIFLNFLKKRGQKVELFSNFPRSKFENSQYFTGLNSNEWMMDELLGRKYPAKFFEILDRILAIKRAPNVVDPESGMPPKYREFQSKLIKFIEKLKLEIVVGQTEIVYSNLNGKIQWNGVKIREKIDGGPKTTLSKAIQPQKAKQKELFKKYKQLNEASLRLYNKLAPQIEEMMDKKTKKEEAKLSEKTVQLASEVKNAFAQILSDASASTSTSKGMSILSMGDTVFEIQHQLCLPTQWVEDQKTLYGGADSEARLLSSVHMNTAMILLAYERVAKFYD